jgi:hypothetical protein
MMYVPTQTEYANRKGKKKKRHNLDPVGRGRQVMLAEYAGRQSRLCILCSASRASNASGNEIGQSSGWLTAGLGFLRGYLPCSPADPTRLRYGVA